MNATHVGIYGLCWTTCCGIWSYDAFTAVATIATPLNLDESYRWN